MLWRRRTTDLPTNLVAATAATVPQGIVVADYVAIGTMALGAVVGAGGLALLTDAAHNASIGGSLLVSGLAAIGLGFIVLLVSLGCRHKITDQEVRRQFWLAGGTQCRLWQPGRTKLRANLANLMMLPFHIFVSMEGIRWALSRFHPGEVPQRELLQLFVLTMLVSLVVTHAFSTVVHKLGRLQGALICTDPEGICILPASSTGPTYIRWADIRRVVPLARFQRWIPGSQNVLKIESSTATIYLPTDWIPPDSANREFIERKLANLPRSEPHWYGE